MKLRLTTIILFIICSLSAFSQDKKAQYSLTPGIFYHGNFLDEYVSGVGLIMGLEYMPHKTHFLSIELRSKYGAYSFDDGAKSYYDEDTFASPPQKPFQPRLEYILFVPQLGLVPKLHWHFDEQISFFLENEFSGGLMMGQLKYQGTPVIKKNVTEPIFCYNIGIGMEYKDSRKWSFVGSISYSTLDFGSKIKKHRPYNYSEKISDQSAYILINAIFKFRLTGK